MSKHINMSIRLSNSFPVSILGRGLSYPKQRDHNPYHVHMPESKHGHDCSDEIDTSRMIFTDDFYIQRPAVDIVPEFLKESDYLNKDCYPDYTEYEYMYLWQRYPTIPQLTGLPTCQTNPSTVSPATTLWKLKHKMR